VDALCRLLSGGAAWAPWSVAARQRYESGFTALHFQRRLRAAIREFAA